MGTETVPAIWYYAEGEKSVGPLSLADLGAILSHISNPSGVLVWRDGFADWASADTVPELAPFVLKPPPLPSKTLYPSTPRSHINPNASTEPFEPAISGNEHPWRRYFARMIDIYLFLLIFIFLLGIVFPQLFETNQQQTTTRGADYLYSFLGLAVYTVFEAICLNLFGSTLGKIVYGIRIRLKDSDQITFTVAFKRALAVWVRGLGIGFPIVTLVTLIVAYQTLKKDGQTSWDRDFNFLIVHRPLPAFRWFIVALVWCLMASIYLFLIALGSH